MNQMETTAQTTGSAPIVSVTGMPYPISVGNPFAPFISGWRNRGLVGRLARREIEARYRGSLLRNFLVRSGPRSDAYRLHLRLYRRFSSKMGGSVEGKSTFALLLFCGLILFPNLFAECLNRAPALMLANTSYIKKVVFPLEILPWVTLMVALFNAAMSYCVLFLAYFVLLGTPPLTTFLLPLIISPILLFALGLTLFFSSVGVFLRDLQQLMGLITMVLMFLSPLFCSLHFLSARVFLSS